jgi:hypothetical protein
MPIVITVLVVAPNQKLRQKPELNGESLKLCKAVWESFKLFGNKDGCSSPAGIAQIA